MTAGGFCAANTRSFQTIPRIGLSWSGSRGLTVSLQEEEQTTLPDVLDRVRVALLPDSELNLFAKHPSYAAESDRLAMAMKRGEPGARFRRSSSSTCRWRHSSRMLIRWFEMDPDDAEQTAMIGLLEAARRFDPDRGYQFSTYAGYWIRNACQRRYGLEWGLPFHVPTHYFWSCYKLEFIETETDCYLWRTRRPRAIRARIARSRHYSSPMAAFLPGSPSGLFLGD